MSTDNLAVFSAYTDQLAVSIRALFTLWLHYDDDDDDDDDGDGDGEGNGDDTNDDESHKHV